MQNGQTSSDRRVNGSGAGEHDGDESDAERFERRLSAVERAVGDGEHRLTDVEDLGELTDRAETLEETLADVEDRVADLEAATQAIRGYVGNVRSMDDDVERQVAAALAAVDRLEDRLDASATRHGGNDRSARACDGETDRPARAGDGETDRPARAGDGEIDAASRDGVGTVGSGAGATPIQSGDERTDGHAAGPNDERADCRADAGAGHWRPRGERPGAMTASSRDRRDGGERATTDGSGVRPGTAPTDGDGRDRRPPSDHGPVRSSGEERCEPGPDRGGANPGGRGQTAPERDRNVADRRPDRTRPRSDDGMGGARSRSDVGPARSDPTRADSGSGQAGERVRDPQSDDATPDASGFVPGRPTSSLLDRIRAIVS